MAQRYESVIYPAGKERIDAELKNVSSIQDPKARLDALFVWEMQDWINPDENLTAFSCLNPSCTYAALTSDPQRIKASPYYDGVLYPQKNPAGVFYADDPYWIAYNRLGECREYSGLFAFMAQESGIPSRLVRTNSHQWVEVELNGTPYYYDPWCADTRGYYNATDGNMTFEDKWFNTIGSYEENCNPPDPYLITYDNFPYLWATPEYLGAGASENMARALNATPE